MLGAETKDLLLAFEDWRTARSSPDPVDVGAQGDLFGAGQRRPGRTEAAAPSGGYRRGVRYVVLGKLRPAVSPGLWLLLAGYLVAVACGSS